MPTFVHKETGKKIFFAHIPRTAGRFIEVNLLANGFEWGERHLDTGLGTFSVVHGIEVAHYAREQYEKYLEVENIPHFSIVRNPVDKFISASVYLKRLYGDDIQSMAEEPMMFSSMVMNMPFEESWNWFRPQVDFLTDKTNIWKFENGFSHSFVHWLSDIVGVKLYFDNERKYSKSPDEHNKLDKTTALVNNIRQVYTEDITRFYPELL